MERFTDDAVVLSTVDYGDADRLVTLLTRGHGRLTAFAAGARSSKRRFAGALQPMTRLRAHLVTRRSDTVRLEAADVTVSVAHVSAELATIARGLHAVELCRELAAEHAPQPALFDAVVGYLGRLDAGTATLATGFTFELAALSAAGLEPSLTRCGRCRGPVAGQVHFDPPAGGLVCERCGATSARRFTVPAALAAALAALQKGEEVALTEAGGRRIREVLDAFVTHHLGRQLRSSSFLAQVGP